MSRYCLLLGLEGRGSHAFAANYANDMFLLTPHSDLLVLNHSALKWTSWFLFLEALSSSVLSEKSEQINPSLRGLPTVQNTT